MSWWLGAGLGFLRGGPFGALVGGVAEHFLGKKLQNKRRNALPGIYNKGHFITCLVIILTRVGIINGPLTAIQIEVIQKFFLKNFNFGAEDFKKCRRELRKSATAKKDSHGNTLPLEKRYSARYFPLDIVFKHAIIGEDNLASLPWYFRVDSWDSYRRYLGAEQEVNKPERMKYNEWNPIGHDGESL